MPNLQRFFERKGLSLKVTDRAMDYQPGDLVTWMVNKKLPHIGIMVKKKSADGKRHLVVHNMEPDPKWKTSFLRFPSRVIIGSNPKVAHGCNKIYAPRASPEPPR